jgi:hypothetical protein
VVKVRELAALAYWLGDLLCDALAGIGLRAACSSDGRIMGLGVLVLSVAITAVIATVVLGRSNRGRH